MGPQSLQEAKAATPLPCQKARERTSRTTEPDTSWRDPWPSWPGARWLGWPRKGARLGGPSHPPETWPTQSTARHWLSNFTLRCLAM